MSVCNRTITSPAATAQLIADAMKHFNGKIKVMPGVAETPPIKKRSAWVDQEAKPRRKAQRKAKPPVCPSKKLDMQRAARKRGNDLLRQEWPELDLKSLAEESGLHKTTILYRLGVGQTLKQATTK
jgi:hypothetical protein